MNQTLLITGVSSGLGLHLARQLLEDGDTVIGISRKSGTASEFSQILQLPQFSYYPCDLSKTSDIDNFIRWARDKRMRFNGVVLNAALIDNDMEGAQFNFEKFKLMIEVNLLGNIYLVSKTLPLVNEGGTFVAISSLSTITDIDSSRIGYPASKAALNTAFQGLRLKFPGSHRFVTVNFGRLVERSGSIFSATYQKAARKILRVIRSPGRSTVSYPIRSAVVLRLLKMLPCWILRPLGLRRV